MGSRRGESLVAAALDGSVDARAEIYRRYADRVHTMCVHMLSDHDEAADVCGQVFLIAFDRLGRLRVTTRLRSWLFSITRHEVYRRTRRRRRIELVGEVERMDQMLHTDQLLLQGDDADEAGTSAAELVAVVRAAADGLDDKDRMVLELQLQELGGDEMAEALGTSASTAYQQVHRMKERFERSLGALLIARTGRADCDELDGLLDGWDGHFSVLWRKRVARHVDRCEVCERRRSVVPATLFGGAGAAAVLAAAGPAGASAEFPAPDAVRVRVLGGTSGSGPSAGPARGPALGRAQGRPDRWLGGRGGRRSLLVGGAVAAVLFVLAMLSGLGVLGGGDGDELVSEGTSTSTTSASTTSTTSTTTPDVSTTVPKVLPTPGATLPVSPTATTVPPPVVAPPGPGAGDVPGGGGGVALPPGTIPPSPAPTVAPPSVWIVASPAAVHHPTPGFEFCGASTPFEAEASAGSVHLRWRTATATVDSTWRVAPGGSRWRGVLELPAEVTGPVVVEAVATVPGATGISAELSLDVLACPTPS